MLFRFTIALFVCSAFAVSSPSDSYSSLLPKQVRQLFKGNSPKQPGQPVAVAKVAPTQPEAQRHALGVRRTLHSWARRRRPARTASMGAARGLSTGSFDAASNLPPVYGRSTTLRVQRSAHAPDVTDVHQKKGTAAQTGQEKPLREVGDANCGPVCDCGDSCAGSSNSTGGSSEGPSKSSEGPSKSSGSSFDVSENFSNSSTDVVVISLGGSDDSVRSSSDSVAFLESSRSSAISSDTCSGSCSADGHGAAQAAHAVQTANTTGPGTPAAALARKSNDAIHGARDEKVGAPPTVGGPTVGGAAGSNHYRQGATNFGGVAQGRGGAPVPPVSVKTLETIPEAGGQL